MLTATVILLSPPFSQLSYALPDYLSSDAFCTGQRVAVPLGKGYRVGIVAAVKEEERAATDSGKEFCLKPILWPLEREPLFSERYLDLATQLAYRQTEPLGRILGSIIPAGLRTTKVRMRFFDKGKPKEIRPQDFILMPPEDRAYFAALWEKGSVEVVRAGLNPLDAELCVLVSDPPWPVRPAAKAQMALLECLFEHGALTRRKLNDLLGKGAAATLTTLCARGLVNIVPADGETEDLGSFAGLPIAPSIVEAATQEAQKTQKTSGFTLTPAQQEIFDSLKESLGKEKAETRLLFGITGSGKTAVYLELARSVLASGKSVLLLAPEVALALKLHNDVAAAFTEAELPKEQRLLFHGYQGTATKEAAFEKLGRSPSLPRLVVGTRSALLLPLTNIGLIILDEEHDSSFKQDEGFTYQAKEVAWYRAGAENALLLMGSATPDIKSFHAAREELIPMHSLSERVGGGTLPEVKIIALGKAGNAAANSLLAPESLETLKNVVSRGEQAVILLNRRGYAPLMYCLACNTVAKCPHCDIGLAYHKGRERLLCHYCGYSVPYPSPCSACNSMNFLPMGEGTEKLEEGLAASLPSGTGILRLDRDSTRRPGRMEAILAAFARKEASVLVGTQMLSKGHHFPDVTLAIVADADLGLNLPDYRAAERTFQLLVQSSGRSGRGEKAGQVLIQTRDPNHYCWEYVRRADYEGFFEHEIALRKRRHYPPFVRLALIRISHDMKDEAGPDAVAALGKVLRGKAKELGVTLLGPAPAPLPFLKGRRRWHCLVKGADWQPLRALYSFAAASALKGPLRVRLDLDPVNML